MARPAISHVQLTKHLSLSECHPDSECQKSTNWWLYDERAGMNIGMRKLTRDEAFISAIEYWAKRALRYEEQYSSLKNKIDTFVEQVVDPEDYEED